jgi:hypothetical protein
LNYSNTVDAGSAKVQTDGELNKDAWTIESNMTSVDDTEITYDEDDPDSGYGTDLTQEYVNSVERIIDNTDSTYTGTSDSNLEITIDMHKTEELAAFKYKGSNLSNVTIQVSNDGEEWTTVKENATFEDCADKYAIVYFDAVEESERTSWIGTYDARYVKLMSTQSGEVSIQEIELCGPSGDNLEFMNVGDTSQPAIGVLTEDYYYDSENQENYIPKGSLIFTGTYKGNPAYNVVVLYDTDGNIIGAKDNSVEAEQVIFAQVPENGNLGETSDGTWVYYVKPGQWDESTLASIKGVRGELYRVDNATTLEGERIVSDTQVIEIPSTLPDITLTAQEAQ